QSTLWLLSASVVGSAGSARTGSMIGKLVVASIAAQELADESSKLVSRGGSHDGTGDSRGKTSADGGGRMAASADRGVSEGVVIRTPAAVDSGACLCFSACAVSQFPNPV